ncbi:MAG: efflux RND transporter periplasmic adaptor subunit [Bacteroidota bacterium]
MKRLFPYIILMPFLFLRCGNAPASDQQQRRPVAFVEVEVARKAPISASLSATGTITAKNEVKILAQTEGKIVKLTVEEGDRVKQGEVLVQLDASVLSAQTKEAEANMEDARANLERAQRLFESKLVADQDFEQAKTRFKVAQARYELQKAMLKYTTITSPISGVVTFRGAREGDIAVPRGHLLTVSDPATLVIEVTVSELEVPKISEGDRVRVTVDAYPNESFAGKVRRVFPASDPVSRLVKIEVQLTQNDPRLFPGLFARAELTTSNKHDAVVLTNDAIITSSTGQPFAFVVVDSVVQRRSLKLGIKDAMIAEVVDGVREGEQVVVVGQSSLNDQMAVRVTKVREQ